MPTEEERYASARYNSEALLRAAGIVGQENSDDVNRMTQDADHQNGALMYTFNQLMDSYREGTVDPHINQSANDVGEIPNTGYTQ
jgi:hypothetical protein